MSIRRAAMIATLAMAGVLGAAAPAAAESGGEADRTEAVGLFRAAFAEYRQALMALKELCTATGAMTDECASGVKELRAFVRGIREMAHETAERIREERKQAEERAREEERQAREAEKRRLEEEKRALEAEKRRVAEEKRKLDEAKRAAEKQRTEQQKKQPTQNVSLDLAKRKAAVRERLAAVEHLMEQQRDAWERADVLLRALREQIARTAPGPERDRLQRLAEDAERATGQYADAFFKYEAEKAQLEAELQRLAGTVPSDVAAKVAKLEQKLRSLDEAIAYKMAKHDELHAQADEYERIAATKAGWERDKYLAKAKELDRQAHEYEQRALSYAAERDAVQAELDRLLGK